MKDYRNYITINMANEADDVNEDSAQRKGGILFSFALQG